MMAINAFCLQRRLIKLLSRKFTQYLRCCNLENPFGFKALSKRDVDKYFTGNSIILYNVGILSQLAIVQYSFTVYTVKKNPTKVTPNHPCIACPPHFPKFTLNGMTWTLYRTVIIFMRVCKIQCYYHCNLPYKCVVLYTSVLCKGID